MRSFFYPRLALQNIRKNKRFYFPYFITCIFSAAMLYDLLFIFKNEGLSELYGGEMLKSFMGFGAWIVGIFICIFLFYTNSFLIKSRKKELGLYNILGMSKRNLTGMLIWESLFTALFTLTVGIAFGIVFSKLMLLLMCYLLGFDVEITFTVSPDSVGLTILLFAVIYLLTLLYNLFCLRLAKPIELLHAANAGEKQPKANYVLALAGILMLGGGYYLALTTEDPVGAVFAFFVAVLLVIFGTYALFISGSIALLKLLRRWKRYYYKPNHFTAVSGMLYRMKQNAAGLASICILSTMVLVMLSTTVCLFVGMEDMVNTVSPRDYSVILRTEPDEQAFMRLKRTAEETIEESGLTVQSRTQVEYVSVMTVKEDNTYTFYTPTSGLDFALVGAAVTAIPSDSYHTLTGKAADLNDGECIAVLTNGSSAQIINPNDVNTITVADRDFHVRWEEEMLPINGLSSYSVPILFLVVNRHEYDLFYTAQRAYYKENASLPCQEVSFSSNGTDEQKLACGQAIQAALSEQCNDIAYRFTARELNRIDAVSLYGGLFFIGIFLGTLFIGFTALIIYYKQISEGYDDKQRFEIMQKVGMSKKEVRRSINSQVLKVFFLPLAVAIIHLAFAFKIITKLLSLLSMANTQLFIACVAGTVAAFAALYFLIYYFTAKVYYKIVKA